MRGLLYLEQEVRREAKSLVYTFTENDLEVVYPCGLYHI